MAASALEISKWFAEGVQKGALYMVVLCDTFDYEDYPVFFETEGAAQKKVGNPGQMQRVMEVYDLNESWSSQSRGRVWNLPKE